MSNHLFEDIVDFERLVKSNNLGYAWANKLGILKRKYLHFIYTLRTNLDETIKLVPPRSRKKFKEDLEHMFYAAEIENELITRCIGLVKKVAKLVHMPVHMHEEALTYGLNSLRTAIWHYRRTDCSFMTFAYNTLYTGFVYTFRRTSKNQQHLQLLHFSDMSKDDTKRRNTMFATTVAEPEPESNEYDLFDIEDLFQAANLSELEIKTLKAYIDRTDAYWARPIIKQYKVENRKVDKVLEFAKRKVRNALRSKYGVTDMIANKILNPRGYQGRAFRTLRTA